MLAIDRDAVLKTAEVKGWNLQGHIQRVYNTFRFRDGRPPGLVTRPGESRPAVQQSLMDWNADLGARHRMDWKGFFAHHQRILQPLAALPRLGLLNAQEIGLVCSVVEQLEQFKDTAGRTLVFGSKAAHFHFPGLVPVVSSDVTGPLQEIERRHPDEIARLVPGVSRRFIHTSAATRRTAYRNYVELGNALTATLDSRTFLGHRSSATYDLHAKIFEWSVIGVGWVVSRDSRVVPPEEQWDAAPSTQQDPAERRTRRTPRTPTTEGAAGAVEQEEEPAFVPPRLPSMEELRKTLALDMGWRDGVWQKIEE